MKKKLLVIDDEITIRTLLVTFLSKNYDVEAKNDGLEALTWLQDGNMPNLIVCDADMPKMNGYEFIQNVRTSGFFKDIPIIMLSGLDTSAERVKYLKAGANDFIVKPFNPEELDVKIEIGLGRTF
ncbi:MAG: response regulator [Bacteroidales bacterium]|nr:response regulator [Bacteroidales bacterium]MCF8456600.1 response regulator [Bacteroidales bacterium]